jgi:hypothetical protein
MIFLSPFLTASFLIPSISSKAALKSSNLIKLCTKASLFVRISGKSLLILLSPIRLIMILIPRIIYTKVHIFKSYNINPNIEILKININDIRKKLNVRYNREGFFMNYIITLT